MQQRSDKRNSKFLVPRKNKNSCADVLDLYLRTIKDKLGKYTGRQLWSGSAAVFINIPMGRNMVSKVPSDMAKRLHLENPGCYTFHSFRRSAATAAADSGATSEQNDGLFWLVKF